MPKTRARRHFQGPLRESKHDRELRVGRVLRALRKAYPDVHVPLDYSTPLELLFATILSAQCTDARVNEVTKGLFGKHRTAADWAAVPLKRLEEEIRPTGFFRNKARAIHESAEDIRDRFAGRVPDTLEELTGLRGVGRKSANAGQDRVRPDGSREAEGLGRVLAARHVARPRDLLGPEACLRALPRGEGVSGRRIGGSDHMEGEGAGAEGLSPGPGSVNQQHGRPAKTKARR